MLLNRLGQEGKLGDLPPSLGDHLPGQGGSITTAPKDLPKRPHRSSKHLPHNAKVCIVGAGMAGLYAALILDHLGVPYDILEAADRPGGRVLTHYFSTRKHDYYDVGLGSSNMLSFSENYA